MDFILTLLYTLIYEFPGKDFYLKSGYKEWDPVICS